MNRKQKANQIISSFSNLGNDRYGRQREGSLQKDRKIERDLQSLEYLISLTDNPTTRIEVGGVDQRERLKKEGYSVLEKYATADPKFGKLFSVYLNHRRKSNSNDPSYDPYAAAEAHNILRERMRDFTQTPMQLRR